MSRKTENAAKRDTAIETLRELLKPNDIIYTILRHCSASGMSRVIDCVSIQPYVETTYPPLPPEKASYPGQVDYDRIPTKRITRHYPRSIGGLVCDATGHVWDDRRQGIKVGGCGMDMGFAIVYTLGRVMWPEGFAPSTLAVRPLDNRLVNIDIGRGSKSGPLTREEVARKVADGWRFPRGGRNGDQSGWDNDGGYALKQQWL